MTGIAAFDYAARWAFAMRHKNRNAGGLTLWHMIKNLWLFIVAGVSMNERGQEDGDGGPDFYVGTPSWTAKRSATPSTHRADLSWGLLLPITSRKSTSESCWRRIQDFVRALSSTTDPESRPLLHIYVGVDAGDGVYDRPESFTELRQLFASDGFAVTIVRLEGASGMLCSIWNQLAEKAVADRADFLVLLGDDVTLETAHWKKIVEDAFSDISQQTGLSYGRACVAFIDRTFPGFPTFPVIHKSHLAVFDRVVPPQFINQDGDPYLFAIYKRWGASVFAPAYLSNGIGGDTDARYMKQPIIWKSTLLPAALRTLEAELGSPTTVCLDVIVPTYRCDVELLRHITDLQVPSGMCVTWTIVVDNPISSALGSIKQLTTARPWCKVLINSSNMGVSTSRNRGIAISDGQWALFLDDDVDVRGSDLLWWYHQAIKRHPSARGFIGTTQLPPPFNLWTQALKLSGVTYFYDIAKRMRHPPWGVGANLVLRHNGDDLWFRHYRNAGGGEDVDICIRASQGGKGLVAVPQAAVKHPWWSEGAVCYRHIAGWAIGDSMCVGHFPHHTFVTYPSGPVFALCLIASGMLAPATVAFACDILVLTLAMMTQHRVNWYDWQGWVVASLACSVIVTQEATRVVAHLSRIDPIALFLDFDWIGDGGRGVVPLRRRRFIACCIATVAASRHLFDHRVVLLTVLIGGLAAYVIVRGGFRHAYRRGRDFVVLSYQRSGSNLICGILHLHPEVLMHNELFNLQAIFSYYPELIEKGRWDAAKRDQDPSGFLSWIWNQRAPYIRTTVGFKSFEEHWHGRQEVYQQLLGDPSILKIILQRRDLLRTYVSLVRSRRTRQCIKGRYTGVKVEIDKEAFFQFVRDYKACFERYECATAGQGQRVLHVYYEDLTGPARAKTLTDVYRFLGVTESVPFRVLPETRPQGSCDEDLRDIVANQDLLCDPDLSPFVVTV